MGFLILAGGHKMRKSLMTIPLLGVILSACIGLCTCASMTGDPVAPSEFIDPYGSTNDARFAAADGIDVITNGGFINDTDSWTFAKEGKKSNPSGSWDPSGYSNGGAAKISSEIGRRKRGIGYWEQIIAFEIQAGSSVDLSYSSKTSYNIIAPLKQGIYISIVKPNGTIVNIDEQTGALLSNNVWVTVTEKDVSTYFDQTGAYNIRLRYSYVTGNNTQAQAFAWFDEVKLLVSDPVGEMTGQWVQKASTPKAGGYGESVGSTESNIYVIRTLYTSSLPQFWSYNPNTNSWVSLSIEGLPAGAFRNGATLTWDNADNLFALGGARYSDADRRVFYRYSISGDIWTQAADAPAPEGAGDAADWSGYDDKLYAILGSSSHGTAFARYDALSNTWDVIASPPAGCDDGASITWTGGISLYALRGEYYESIPLQDFWSYDIVNNSWTTLTPIPEEDGVGDGASLIWIGDWNISQIDYVYALGGGAVDEKPGHEFYRYSISNDSWETLPAIPFPIGYYNGNRLGFTSDHIFYWQGSPTSYSGGGKKFARFEL